MEAQRPKSAGRPCSPPRRSALRVTLLSLRHPRPSRLQDVHGSHGLKIPLAGLRKLPSLLGAPEPGPRGLMSVLRPPHMWPFAFPLLDPFSCFLFALAHTPPRPALVQLWLLLVRKGRTSLEAEDSDPKPEKNTTKGGPRGPHSPAATLQFPPPGTCQPLSLPGNNSSCYHAKCTLLEAATSPDPQPPNLPDPSPSGCWQRTPSCVVLGFLPDLSNTSSSPSTASLRAPRACS